jgi:hypothetical protein
MVPVGGARTWSILFEAVKAYRCEAANRDRSSQPGQTSSNIAIIRCNKCRRRALVIVFICRMVLRKTQKGQNYDRAKAETPPTRCGFVKSRLVVAYGQIIRNCLAPLLDILRRQVVQIRGPRRNAPPATAQPAVRPLPPACRSGPGMAPRWAGDGCQPRRLH